MLNPSELFERELNLIQFEDYRNFIRDYLDEATPNYFWEVGASSSGKFHPVFSQGVGGLVRHTKAVVMFAEELLRMSSYSFMSDEYKDYVIMACIVHDTCKYGVKEYDKKEYPAHAVNAANNVVEYWDEYFCGDSHCPELLYLAIKSHMGQWSEKNDRPFTQIDRCVHMADYIASRPFIDIPAITEEYNSIILNENELDLPF